jgi:hypothetical protein
MFYQIKWYCGDDRGSCIVSNRDSLSFILDKFESNKIPFMVYHDGLCIAPISVGFGCFSMWFHEYNIPQTIKEIAKLG